jgi:hypothetical protein
MAFIDDLAKGNAIFLSNAAGLMKTRAINQANQLADNVKDSELKEEEQRRELKRIANALVGDLAAQGVDPRTIGSAREGISPAPRMFQTAEQAIINPQLATPEQQAAGLGVFGAKQAEKRQLLSQKKADRLEVRSQKFFEQVAPQFQKANKTIIDGLDFSKRAANLAIENDYASIQPSIIRGIMKLMGEGARMSDFDIKSATPGQSIPLRIKNAFEKNIRNAISSNNKEELLNILGTLERGAKRTLVRKAERFASGRGKIAEKFKFDLSKREFFEQALSMTPISPQDATKIAPQAGVSLDFDGQLGQPGAIAPGAARSPAGVPSIPGLVPKGR